MMSSARRPRPAAPGVVGLRLVGLLVLVLMLGIGAGLVSLLRLNSTKSTEAMERAELAMAQAEVLGEKLDAIQSIEHAVTSKLDALEAHLTAIEKADTSKHATSASQHAVDTPTAKPAVEKAASAAITRPMGAALAPGIAVIVTSNGNRYMNWQTRICYKSFLTQAAQPGSQLRAFTRLLHRASDDELMHEVPTVRIASGHPDCDVWCTYPVADRGPALMKYLRRKEAWAYEHVLVIETDYVFVAPLNIELPSPGHGISFPFGYIVPTYSTVEPIMARYYDGPAADIPGTGNAPVLIGVADLARVVPVWSDVTETINNDKEAVDVFGWVREMYAYSIASARIGIKYDMEPVPDNQLMVQPPADEALGKAAICHYTWGTILKDKSTGKEVWRWDKREYGQGQYGEQPVVPLLLIPEMPAWSSDLVTQDDQPFSRGKYDLLQMMRTHFNHAATALNEVNNGVPKGFASLAEATKAAKPSAEAWVARRKVEKEEAEARAKAARAG